MKRFVAVFADEKYGFETTRDCENMEETELYESETLVRKSEWVEVDFPALSRNEVVADQLRVIRHIREETVEKFSSALAVLDDRESKLLALTSDGNDSQEA